MPGVLLPALSMFAILTVVLTVIDVRTRRLPDAIVLGGGLGLVSLLCAAAVASHQPERIGVVVAGAAAAFCACLLVHLARPGDFGGGDVKLAALCGSCLGYFGFEAVASGIALGFVVGGVAAAGALLAGERGATIAFGPFLLVGTWWRVLIGPW